MCADSYVNYGIEELVLEHKKPLSRRSRTVKTDAGLVRLNQNVVFTSKLLNYKIIFFSEKTYNL